MSSLIKFLQDRRTNPDRGTPPRPATVKSRTVSGIISRSLAALKAPLSLSGKAIQSNPKRSKKAPWPRWLAKSEFPIYDYFQEYDEVQDEQTLLRLFELEKRRLPDLTVERIEFTPEKIAYLTTSDRPTSSLRQAGSGSFVYPREVDGTFQRKEPRDFLNDISFNSREQDYFDFYPEDRFNDEFWSSPPPLYHGTNALSAVKKQGILPMFGTRGINNRYIGAAVFATTNQEVAESYRYGPDGGVLKIDTQAMKRDGLMPRVIQEPEVLEQELIGSISYRIGIHHDTEYSDSGIDPETIIIFSGIPAKYLRAI